LRDLTGQFRAKSIKNVTSVAIRLARVGKLVHGMEHAKLTPEFLLLLDGRHGCES
jgi:hypothetical protein